MAESLNLLFTSVGRRVSLLRMFREALDQCKIPGRIIAVDCSTHAAALQVADSARIVLPLNDPRHRETLLEIVAREEVRVVFPLIDPDVPVLASMRAQLRAIGAAVATVAESALPAVEDKWEAVQLFNQLEIPSAQSWLPEQIDDIPRSFPLFIKPRHGSASEHCYKIHNEHELRFFVDYIPQPIIQEYLTGPEITNDVICDLQGNVLDIVSRERGQVRGGEVTVGRTRYDSEVADQAARIARAVGATGPITVQCILKDGQARFTEINARLGGGATCATLAGATWPRDLIASFAGKTVTPRIAPSYRTDVVFSRFHDALEAKPIPIATAPEASPQTRSLGGDQNRDGVYLIGSGGHAKVIWSLLRSLGYRVLHVFDDDLRRTGSAFCDMMIEGPIEMVSRLPPRPTVLAIGSNADRRRLAEQLNLPWMTLVHPRATVDPTVRLGAGTVVMAGAVIQAETQIGCHAIINTSASVDHDCRLGDYSHVAPGARLAGEVSLGDEVFMGTGGVAIPRVLIGHGTIVGAGAVVTSDLPSRCVAKGVPARVTERLDRLGRRSEAYETSVAVGAESHLH